MQQQAHFTTCQRGTLRVNIVYHDNGAGLSTDAVILTSALEAAGVHTTVSPRPAPSLRHRVSARAARWRGQPRYDLNIFLEAFDPGWGSFARRNLLIPNQEWFTPQSARDLRKLDGVLCKTREGMRAFDLLGAPTRYLGFTSLDHRLDPAPPRVNGALHVAGRSLRKGTIALLQAWQQHPGWPLLTVVQRPPSAGYPLHQPQMANVRFLTERISDAELRELQNSHWLHIRPSEVEGFGHPFVESMSCGAVVIATDAPPMNELVDSDRGLLVAAAPYKPQGIGMRYKVDPSALATTIQRALDLTLAERTGLGKRAREWFEANDRAFRERLPRAITP